MAITVKFAMSAALGLEISNNIARLVINRPARKNALDAAMWASLPALLAKAAASARVLILSGAGGNFCAGADISEFATVRKDAESARAYEAVNSAAFRALRETPIPVIAAIDGICYGGGFGLAAACDIRLATPDARFSVPAARLGLAYPQDAMADIVAACGPQLAKYLTFTGAVLSAEDALGAGFLMEVHLPAVLEGRVGALARQIADAAPLSVRASKASIRAVTEPGFAAEAARLGALTFDSADYAEGRAAFAERRKPVFTGS